MKIAYLIDYDLNGNSGVIQKIRQQSSQWRVKGHTIYFVSSKTMTVYDADYRVVFKTKLLDINLGRIGTAINLFYSTYVLSSFFQKIEFDFIYMRYRMYMPFISRVLKRYKVVMEINSDDIQEYKLHSRVTSIYNKMTRNYMLKNINAFVSVSHELREKFTYLDKPIVVIGNGISSEEYSLIVSDNKVPTLVFIGTPNQSWHGVDKIEMMAEYFKKYQFCIIGTDGEDGENIKYFGYLSNEESSKVISQCDVGIGTLSLYKTGLTEASPLKTRQYLACGLPVVYAYKDTDIVDDVKFGLRLENHEDNLNYPRIKQFIEKVFGDEDIRLEARVFSQEVLDYSKKEEKRLDFFKRVLNEK